MSPDQHEVLDRFGVLAPTAEEARERAARQQRLLAKRLEALRLESLTLEEFAAASGVDVATLRNRIAQRALWAFDDDTLLPVWQLHEGALLRGLDEVVPRVPVGMAPTAVEAMLTGASVDLYIDAESVSVVSWLRAGLDPTAAAAAIGVPAERT